MGDQENIPTSTYMNHLRLSAAVLNQSFPNNFLSHKNFDLESLFYDAEGNNYLEYLSPTQLARKHSRVSFPTKKIYEFSSIDICGMTRSNVSLECCSNLQYMFTAAAKKQSWAWQMIDSFGKLPSGILQGNLFFPGSYDECLSTTVINGSGGNQQQNIFNPKYCQINFPAEQSTFWMMRYAVCIPDSCKPDEINYIFHEGIHLLPIHIKKGIKTYVTCPQKQAYSQRAIFSLVISSIFIALLLTGTFYDVLYIQLDLKQKLKTAESSTDVTNITYNSTDEPVVDQYKKLIIPPNKTPSWFEQFLLCFSIYKNASKLFKTDLPKGSLSSVHGIRFISMTWVILGHTYIFGMSVWSNSKDAYNLLSRFSFQAIGNATVSVDTFFMLSGLLVVYGVMHLMKANNGKMNWLYFYVHRFWRLTPPYMLVLMVYVPLLQYWGDGPYWPITGVEKDYCSDTWWYNLLYINNFNDTECMAWSWYLANDMQFYVISPIILFFLYKKPKIGLGILSALMLAQLITCGVIMKVKHYSGLLTPGYFNEIYVKPYIRIGSYLVGMFYGYLLYKTNCKMIINKYIVAMLWLFATICAIAVLYGLYDTFHGSPMSTDLFAFYTTIHRIVWALSVGWVVYACVTGYGGFVNTILSWKPLIPLSRLTYCAYLVHPVVMESFYLNSRYPVYLTDFEAIYLFFGHLVMSYLVAFVVSMAFEAPMIALESLFRNKNNNK